MSRGCVHHWKKLLLPKYTNSTLLWNFTFSWNIIILLLHICQTSFIRFETWMRACFIYRTHTFNYLNNFVKTPLVKDLPFYSQLRTLKTFTLEWKPYLPQQYDIWYISWNSCLLKPWKKVGPLKNRVFLPLFSWKRVLIHWMFIHWIVAKLITGKGF